MLEKSTVHPGLIVRTVSNLVQAVGLVGISLAAM